MTEDYRTRSRLLLGDDGMEKLDNSCVMVCGTGGVGSHTAEALARSGVGTLILIDPDTVRPSNINRQAQAFACTVGKPKVHVMAEKLKAAVPGIRLIIYSAFLLPDNLERVMRSLPVQPDYIADCVDTVSAKIALIEYAEENRIPIIASMGTANKLHPEMFRIGDIHKTSVCPLCRVMRKELKARNIPKLDVLWSDEEPIKQEGRALGSVSFVPPAAGLLIAGHIIRKITGKE